MKEFWDNMENDSTFRQWKLEEWFLDWHLREEGSNLAQELNNKKIDYKDGPDKIWWGYRPPRNFSIKEATSLASGVISLPLGK